LGNLAFQGGVVELNFGNFARGTGTAATQVQWLGSGGFSAAGSARTVNLGGSSGTLIWGSGGFVPIGSEFLLGSASDTATIDFQNPIDFGATLNTVRVTHGTAAVDARLSGRLNGGGGLTLAGNGTLELTGSNTYTGATTVGGGTLRLAGTSALPGGAGTSGGLSNLVFAGGIVELSAGDFARGAGTAGSQVQWLGSGGFSAVGGSRVVNLGGSSGTLAWGSGGFVPNGSALILGSAGDTAAVDFQNPIDLGAGIRTVQVNRGSSPVDAILSGRLGGSGGLMKTGDGALVLSGSNAFTGGLTVTGGIVDITVSGALPDGGSLIVVSSSTHFPTFFSPVVGGPEAPVAAPAAVPEPCTPMLLACGGLLIAAALRRAAVKNTRESKRGRRNRNGDAGSIDRRRCGG
jgi:autotransporter-associated beta strand protein